MSEREIDKKLEELRRQIYYTVTCRLDDRLNDDNVSIVNTELSVTDLEIAQMETEIALTDNEIAIEELRQELESNNFLNGGNYYG